MLGLRIVPGLHFVADARAGVYLFFTLSAFLLTLLILRSPRPGEPANLARYAARRVLRVYPLYAVVLIVTWVSLSWWPGYQRPLVDELSGWSVVQHLLLQEGFGVFWTLGVEFQYYVLLPFVALGLLALRERPKVAIGLSILLIGGVHMAFPPGDYPRNTLFIGPYLPIFLQGSLAAFVHFKLDEAGWRPSETARRWLTQASVSSAGFVFLLNGSFWSSAIDRLEHALAYAHYFTLYGALCSICLLSHLHVRGRIWSLLASRPLRFLGIVSFSIYLLHPMAIFAARALPFESTVLGAGCSLALLVCASALSYLAIERPFLRLGRGGRVGLVLGVGL